MPVAVVKHLIKQESMHRTMDRNHYKLFSAGAIGGLSIPNRLVRSATWDPSILTARQMTGEVLDLFFNLAGR